MNEKLKNYIDKMREQGFSDEQIRSELKKSGWEDEHVNESVNLNAPEASIKNLNPEKRNGLNKKYLTIIVLGVFLMVSGIFVALFTELWSPSWNPFIPKDGEETLEETKQDVKEEQKPENIIAVQWLQEPQEEEGGDVFASFTEKHLVNAEINSKPDSREAQQGRSTICSGTDCLSELFGWKLDYDHDTVYLLGNITDGKHKGGKLYLVDSYGGHCGPCARYRMVVMPNGDVTLLQKYSNEYMWNEYSWEEDYFKKYIPIDSVTEIPDLHPPKEIAIPNSALKLVPKYTPHILFSTWSDSPTSLFESEDWGGVYAQSDFYTERDFGGSGDMGIRLKDGSVFQYQFDLPFFEYNSSKENFLGVGIPSTPFGSLNAEFVESGSPVAPDQSFNSANSAACSGYSSGYFVNTSVTINDKFPKAHGPEGETLYVLNFDHPYLRELYEENIIDKYQNDNNDNMSYEEFLSITPVVFWRDPFDRLIEFRNGRAVSVSDCGTGIPPSPLVEPR